MYPNNVYTRRKEFVPSGFVCLNSCLPTLWVIMCHLLRDKRIRKDSNEHRMMKEKENDNTKKKKY